MKKFDCDINTSITKSKEEFKQLFGGCIRMIQGIRIKIIILVVLFICVGWCYSFASDDPFAYLRELTAEELDFDQLNKAETEYMYNLIGAPIEKVLPYQIQKKILNTEFFELNEILNQIQYSKFWKIESYKCDLYENWPIEIYKLVRYDIRPSRIIAYVVYNHLSGVYNILGFENISIERFNKLIDIKISSPLEAICFASDSIKLLENHQPVDEELLNKQELLYSYIQANKHSFYPPKLVFESKDYYVVEMFSKWWKHFRWLNIYKIIVVVKKDGGLVYLSEHIYNEEDK